MKWFLVARGAFSVYPESRREKKKMPTETKPKIGRPRNSEAPKFINLRVRRDQHKKMKEQAAAVGMELSPWIRFICLEEIRRRRKSAA